MPGQSAIDEGDDARSSGPLPPRLHLFQFTTRRLRDFIDPNHLLIQIAEQLEFAMLSPV